MHPSAPVTSQRSSDIPIDRDFFGVELDRRGALLVRAVTGGLRAAERYVHVGPGGLRVDVQDARLELRDAALGRRQTAREYRRGEPEADRIGARDRLVERPEAVQRRDRAEDLLAGEEGVVADALEYGRGDQVGVRVGPLTPGQQRRAFVTP